jgi:hypothetical protein
LLRRALPPTSPCRASRATTSYFFPPDFAVGEKLIFSFDLTTDPAHDNDAVDGAEIYLHNVAVYSVPAP